MWVIIPSNKKMIYSACVALCFADISPSLIHCQQYLFIQFFFIIGTGQIIFKN